MNKDERGVLILTASLDISRFREHWPDLEVIKESVIGSAIWIKCDTMDLDVMQRIVGGYIERVPVVFPSNYPAVDLWANEEGLINGLSICAFQSLAWLAMGGHQLRGDCLLAARRGAHTLPTKRGKVDQLLAEFTEVIAL
jgi:hypothetical protein